MNTKTMEGLVGAKTNMDLVNTPMRVYREARSKGDTGAMERAMGYATDFAGKAEAYKTKADKGMKEEAKELREKEKLECEKAIEKRREEREKLEARIEKNKENKIDTIEVSEEGKVLVKDTVKPDGEISTENTEGNKEAIIYTKAGEVSQTEQGSSISISV